MDPDSKKLLESLAKKFDDLTTRLQTVADQVSILAGSNPEEERRRRAAASLEIAVKEVMEESGCAFLKDVLKKPSTADDPQLVAELEAKLDSIFAPASASAPTPAPAPRLAPTLPTGAPAVGPLFLGSTVHHVSLPGSVGETHNLNKIDIKKATLYC
jgi:hypothetical protein